MFLKSLVIRGFKSFANKTTLAFEPGISVVVGPNGSGKSNVVDAICWVLGEQGPASLRGGKMADVIFAGSGFKAPLGWAEVQLTIDNSAGLLPVDFSEVSISRALFRSGDSEYRLNGSVCRLLDIQEMLSDAGVGRAQHTIVGQGRVDQVLAADPMAIRNIIEDAAGVGKHRRRRERALRKIESCEANLVHLGDLLAEIRRQLKPLRQQAEIARRHERVDRELRRILLIQASRELAGILGDLGPARTGVDREELLTSRQRELARLDDELAQLEEVRMDAASEAARYRELQLRLEGGLERLEALRRLASERGRALRAELAGSSEAAERARIQELQRQLDLIEPELAEAVSVERAEAQEQDLVDEPAEAARLALAGSEEAVAGALKRQADAAARVAGLEREREAIGKTLAQAGEDRDRYRQCLEALQGEMAADEEALAAAKSRLEAHDREAGSGEEQLAAAEQGLAERDAVRAECLEEVRSLEKQAAVLEARLGAQGSGTRSPSAGRSRQMVSGVAELEPGHRRALEALVGPLDSAAVAGSRDEVGPMLDDGDPDEAVTVLIAQRRTGEPIPGTEPLLDRVKVVDPVAEDLLSNTFLATDRTTAIHRAGEHPECIFLSPDGTVARGGQVVRGSAEVAGLLQECQAKLAEAGDALARAEGAAAAARRRRAEALDARREAGKDRARREQDWRTADRRYRETVSRWERSKEALERAEAACAGAQGRLEDVDAATTVAGAELDEAERDLERARKRRAAQVASYEEVSAQAQQVRMRAGIAAERADQLRRRKRQAAAALEEAGRRLEGLAAKQRALTEALDRAASVMAVAGKLAHGGAGWPKEAEANLARAKDELHVSEQRLAGLRARRTELSAEVEKVRVEAHNEDLRRGELSIRQRILEARLAEEMGADPQLCVQDYGAQAILYEEESSKDPLDRLPALDDDALQSRRNRLERELARMGNVNPLAAAEAQTLAEREEFLSAQINDVRTSRKDLREVVTSVDAKIEDLFGTAFADVAVEYEKLFGILFPRGKGRLRLSEPAEMLESGVEVEASPSGKSLKRLSLLSGGERAMAGLALLFAVFKARPSPFYILDEVEAALDDVNLQRFLGLLNEFRGTSQLLVVTHQKRTMEVADVLYGVTIGQDGVSKVVSERLKDFFPTGVEVPGEFTQRTRVYER